MAFATRIACTPQGLTLVYVTHTGSLVAILATPPLVTSGERSLARVRLAAEILGLRSVTVTNLLDVATRDVIDIAHAGRDPEPWLDSRDNLTTQLATAGAVLLAWGTTSPSGPARHHHRAQIAWIADIVRERSLACWTVGGTPRHPSRWQRYTSREHPNIPFSVALAASLRAT